jgi:hypothetical protein
VEIRYEGVVISKITGMAGTMDQGGVLQLQTTEPMPVGTRLELCAGPDVSFVRVVRVTEGATSDSSTMHVRAVGQSEPYEVTLLPNPDYLADARARAEIPRAPEPPPVAPPPPAPPAPPPIVEAAGSDAEAVPEAIGNEGSLNGAGDHSGTEEISGLIDTGASGEMPGVGGNGAVNKRRRRRRR